MEEGTKVEVRSQFDQAWSAGFEVAACEDGDDEARYRVRRLSDGMILPRTFDEAEVRRERKRGMWWYR